MDFLICHFLFAIANLIVILSFFAITFITTLFIIIIPAVFSDCITIAPFLELAATSFINF